MSSQPIIQFAAGPVVIFDFDGTVCLGAGSIQAYADAALDGLTPEQKAAALDAVRNHRDPRWQDDFAAVSAVAREAGIGDEQLSAAYLISRAGLAEGTVPISAPPGLPEFLRQLPTHKVLVTNSPLLGIVESLDRLGMGGAFDQIVTEGGKPAAWPVLMQDLLPIGPDDEPHPVPGAERILSIGDHWANEIGPLRDWGCRTAYIGPDDPERPCDWVADTFPELYAPILGWARHCREAA